MGLQRVGHDLKTDQQGQTWHPSLLAIFHWSHRPTWHTVGGGRHRTSLWTRGGGITGAIRNQKLSDASQTRHSAKPGLNAVRWRVHLPAGVTPGGPAVSDAAVGAALRTVLGNEALWTHSVSSLLHEPGHGTWTWSSCHLWNGQCD